VRTWLTTTREQLRAQLWPLPAAAVSIAVALGLALPEIDSALGGGPSGWAGGWLFGGDADAARSLLGAIASSMITVTALT
jgi:uncharacterized membrane protein